MCFGDIFLPRLTSRHKAFSAGLECPGQWPWYTKDSVHKNRTRGEKRRGSWAVWWKGCKIFHKLGSCHNENGESRLIKYLLFSKKILKRSKIFVQIKKQIGNHWTKPKRTQYIFWKLKEIPSMELLETRQIIRSITQEERREGENK